jgi:hypothetical protein
MEKLGMETTAVKRTEIQKQLSILPQEKLQQVSDFVEFVLFQSKVEHKRVVKLGGIWKNLGFEKIDDLEAEIRKIRQDASSAILKKEL